MASASPSPNVRTPAPLLGPGCPGLVPSIAVPGGSQGRKDGSYDLGDDPTGLKTRSLAPALPQKKLG